MGHPLKLIAYELGLALTTVAGSLARGKKKLGVASDAELIGLLAPNVGTTDRHEKS